MSGELEHLVEGGEINKWPQLENAFQRRPKLVRECLVEDGK